MLKQYSVGGEIKLFKCISIKRHECPSLQSWKSPNHIVCMHKHTHVYTRIAFIENSWKIPFNIHRFVISNISSKLFFCTLLLSFHPKKFTHSHATLPFFIHLRDYFHTSNNNKNDDVDAKAITNRNVQPHTQLLIMRCRRHRLSCRHRRHSIHNSWNGAHRRASPLYWLLCLCYMLPLSAMHICIRIYTAK